MTNDIQAVVLVVLFVACVFLLGVGVGTIGKRCE